MRNVLKYRKIFQNGSVRLPFGCGYYFIFFMFSTVGLNFDILQTETRDVTFA